MALKGKMEKMRMSDGAEIGVYRAQPSVARRGGLVLIQEIFGVTEHIMELCDGYAADGYEVLGPALYDREAPNFQATYSPEDIQKAIKIARGEGASAPVTAAMKTPQRPHNRKSQVRVPNL